MANINFEHGMVMRSSSLMMLLSNHQSDKPLMDEIPIYIKVYIGEFTHRIKSVLQESKHWFQSRYSPLVAYAKAISRRVILSKITPVTTDSELDDYFIFYRDALPEFSTLMNQLPVMLGANPIVSLATHTLIALNKQAAERHPLTADINLEKIKRGMCFMIGKRKKDKLVRFQFEVDSELWKEMDEIQNLGGMSTKRELINNALTLIRWAALHALKGNSVAALSADETVYELQMPFLHSIALRGQAKAAEESEKAAVELEKAAVENVVSTI